MKNVVTQNNTADKQTSTADDNVKVSPLVQNGIWNQDVANDMIEELEQQIDEISGYLRETILRKIQNPSNRFNKTFIGREREEWIEIWNETIQKKRGQIELLTSIRSENNNKIKEGSQ